MISDEKLTALCAAWDAFTPEKKQQIRDRAAQLRGEAARREPFANPNLESFRLHSEEIADFMDVEAAPAIEVAILEELQTPTVIAWERAYRHVAIALLDEAVQVNPVAVQVLDNALEQTMEATGYASLEDLQSPAIHQAVSRALSRRARDAASSKNIAARAWVVTEWTRRTDKDQSKNAFARQHVQLVKKRFDLAVTTETIARDWLPKAEK